LKRRSPHEKHGRKSEPVNTTGHIKVEQDRESYRPQIGVQRAAGFIVVKARPRYSECGAQPSNRVQSMATSVFEAWMTAD
jgi:hypothetical protein